MTTNPFYAILGLLFAGLGIYLAHQMWHYGRGETN